MAKHLNDENKKKRKIKIDANEIVEADVSYISLVKSPANRIPFRITKSESIGSPLEGLKKMKIFSMFGSKKAEEKPEIMAVVVPTDLADKLRDKLLAIGLEVEDVEQHGDMTLYKQKGFDEDENLVQFKLNEYLGVLVSGVQKSFHAFPDSLDFNKNIKTSGFFPGVHLGTDALMDTIYQIMYDAETSDAAKGLLTKATEAYGKYIAGLVNSLPAIAFKMEKIMPGDVEKSTGGEGNQSDIGAGSGDQKADHVGKNDEGKDMTRLTEVVPGDLDGLTEEKTVKIKDDQKDAAKIDTQKADDKDAGKSTDTIKNDGEADKDNENKTATKGSTEAMEKMLSLMESFKSEMVKGITDVKELAGESKKSLDELTARMDAVEKVAKSANEAVHGTVQNNVGDESLSTLNRKAKSEVHSDALWEGALDLRL